MSEDEIKSWINRWSKLKPSPKRDMVIKLWTRSVEKQSGGGIGRRY